MAKTANAKTPPETDAKPVRKPRRRMIGLVVAGVTAMVATTGGYFALGSAGAETPASPEAGAVASAAIPVPMPVAVLEANGPTAARDYQIVSIYGDEAILAVGRNLLRVKAGSVAPGLGTVTAIEPRADGGGSVVGTEATLSTS